MIAALRDLIRHICRTIGEYGILPDDSPTVEAAILRRHAEDGQR